MALLEIARLFSLLYSNPKTRGRYNLLFGFTSGGPYNYNGTQKVLAIHCFFVTFPMNVNALSTFSFSYFTYVIVSSPAVASQL